MTKQNIKTNVKQLEALKDRLEVARERLSALDDELIREQGAAEMRLDFVRTWKFVRYIQRNKPPISIPNFNVRKGLSSCDDFVEKQLTSTERAISNLRFKMARL